jgi:hypothetical protein
MTATELVPLDERPHPQRWLFRADGSAFAYARGHDFIRVRDHLPWAHLSNEWLLSARSGTPLAYRVGNVFFDVATNTPIYYQSD